MWKNYGRLTLEKEMKGVPWQLNELFSWILSSYRNSPKNKKKEAGAF